MTIDELEEKVQIVHAHQGRQAKILLELLGLDKFENEKVDIVEPVIYDEEDFHDSDMINEDIFNKNKDDGKTRSLLGVFPFNNFTNSNHHAEHNHQDHDHEQHNHEEEDPDEHNNHHEELGALGVFPFNNFTNPDPHAEHHHHDQDHDQDQHNHEEEEEDQQHNHHEEHEDHDHHNHYEEHVHEHEETSDVGDPVTALRTPLSNRTQDVFPFTLGVKSNEDVQDTSSFSISQLPQQINSVGVSDGKGKKCIDKVSYLDKYKLDSF